nr:MAG TPA: hypothetical protein [Caudoviricetes sp.]
MIKLEEGQEIKGTNWAIPFIVVLKYRDFIVCKQKHNKTISNILLIDTLTNTVYYGIKSLSFLNSNVTTQKHYLDEIKANKIPLNTFNSAPYNLIIEQEEEKRPNQLIEYYEEERERTERKREEKGGLNRWKI